MNAVTSRGALYPYLVLLAEAFALLDSQASHSDPSAEDRIQAARAFQSAVKAYAERVSGSFGAPLFSEDVKRPGHAPWTPPSEPDVVAWCHTLQIPEDDTSRLVALCCHQPDTAESLEEPRSVRTL